MKVKTISTPPPPYKRQHIRIASILSALSLLICAIALSCFIQYSQTSNAATAGYTGNVSVSRVSNFSAVPKLDVVIDKNLYICNAKFSTTNSNFVYTEWNSWGRDSAYTKLYGTAYFQGKYNAQICYKPYLNKTSASPSGYFTLKWTDIGYDAEGNRVDLLLTVKNIKITATSDWWKYSDGNGYYPIVFNRAGNLEVSAMRKITAEYDLDVQFFKKGTSTPCSGNFLMSFVDLDCQDEGVMESVTLVSGYDPVSYVRSDCTLSITNNNKTYGPYSGMATDEETYRTGFVVPVAASHFAFHWRGNDAWTRMLMPFEEHTITASKTPAGGGTITNEGTVKVPWKNNKTYTINAAANWKIKSVKVDGTAINVTNTKTMSYTFSTVTANHTIQAEFEQIKVSLRYDKNLPSATGTTPTQTNIIAGSTASVAHSGFTADKYIFSGWNTKPDGSGTAYAPGAAITMPETDVTLYAQWFSPDTVIFIDGITGEEISRTTVPRGSKIPESEIPPHPEHDFHAANGYDRPIDEPVTEDPTTITLLYQRDDLITVPARIEWKDNNDYAKKRPQSVTLTLIADGIEIDSHPLNADNGWENDFEGLPAHDAADGHLIVYQVVRKQSNGVPDEYLATDTSLPTESGNTSTGLAVEAVYVATISIPVTKVWDDMDDIYGERPSEIIVTLSEKVQDEWMPYANIHLRPETSEEKGQEAWQAAFTDIPLWDAETEEMKEWRVEEPEVYGYDLVSIDANGSELSDGFTLTNRIWKHIDMPETGESGVLVWVWMMASSLIIFTMIGTIATRTRLS